MSLKYFETRIEKLLNFIILKVLDIIQTIVLRTSYFLFSFFRDDDIGWVVGTDEVAGVLESIADSLPKSRSVNLSVPNLRQSNFAISISGFGRLHMLKRMLLGPIILGRLANHSNQFFYIWSRGFLVNRSSEFRFLKQRNKMIALMFCGDDIRSPKLHRELCERMNRRTFVNQGFYLNPPGGSEKYEAEKKLIAGDAETFADVIFNAPICQSSYLSRHSTKVVDAHGYISIRAEDFCWSDEKFEAQILRIVHAPSSEAVKGTAYVRAAITELLNERNDFVYIELQNKKHQDVIKILHESHICLNQFLSFGTGVLGVEAMASRCATLMSADHRLEPSIPKPAMGISPWLVTGVDDIYNNVKNLLDNRNILEEFADNGFNYAVANYSRDAARRTLLQNLVEHGFDVNE